MRQYLIWNSQTLHVPFQIGIHCLSLDHYSTIFTRSFHTAFYSWGLIDSAKTYGRLSLHMGITHTWWELWDGPLPRSAHGLGEGTTNDEVQPIFIPHNQHMLNINDWVEWLLGAVLRWLGQCWCLHDLSNPDGMAGDNWSSCTPAAIHLIYTLECDTVSPKGRRGGSGFIPKECGW